MALKDKVAVVLPLPLQCVQGCAHPEPGAFSKEGPSPSGSSGPTHGEKLVWG